MDPQSRPSYWKLRARLWDVSDSDPTEEGSNLSMTSNLLFGPFQRLIFRLATSSCFR
jgi:hypothetical protein